MLKKIKVEYLAFVKTFRIRFLFEVTKPAVVRHVKLMHASSPEGEGSSYVSVLLISPLDESASTHPPPDVSLRCLCVILNASEGRPDAENNHPPPHHPSPPPPPHL